MSGAACAAHNSQTPSRSSIATEPPSKAVVRLSGARRALAREHGRNAGLRRAQSPRSGPPGRRRPRSRCRSIGDFVRHQSARPLPALKRNSTTRRNALCTGVHDRSHRPGICFFTAGERPGSAASLARPKLIAAACVVVLTALGWLALGVDGRQTAAACLATLCRPTSRAVLSVADTSRSSPQCGRRWCWP